MTDQPDEPQPLDPLSPEDETRVRGLLADARADGSMPPEVAARLDQALVDLAGERIAIDPVPADNVVPVARTRRHRVVAVLGAAAAVVVLGLAVGSFVRPAADDADTAAESNADTAVDRGAAQGGSDRTEVDAPDADRFDADLTDPDPYAVDQHFRSRRTHVVRPGHLTADLARIQHRVLPDPSAGDYSRAELHAPARFACKNAEWGAGILVAVEFDGDPAYVAFRAPVGDAQVVDVLQCGTGDVLRTTTLPTNR